MINISMILLPPLMLRFSYFLRFFEIDFSLSFHFIYFRFRFAGGRGFTPETFLHYRSSPHFFATSRLRYADAAVFMPSIFIFWLID